MKRRGSSLVLAAVLSATGCGPSTFQRHLEAHRWVDAAQAFAADSAIQRNEQALFRAGLLHATPGTPVYDPARARSLIERLLELHPSSRQRETAEHLLPMLAALEHTDEQARREQELREEIERLSARLEQLRTDRNELLDRLAVEQEQREFLRRAVDRLEADVREREQQLRALRTELDRLKAIDLRPPERPAATTPPPGGRGT